MYPLRCIAYWLPLALLLPLTGCSGGSSGKPQVAFVSNNKADFWTIAEAGCRKAEKEVDVEVLFRTPDPGDQARQTEILTSLRNQKVKAIAVSVIDPRGQAELLDEIAGKIPLITQDNDAPNTKRKCYIGTNNYKAGRAVGELVKEAMPEGGTVALFVGDTKPLNARQRCWGVLDVLAGKDDRKDVDDLDVPPKEETTYGKYVVAGTYTDQPQGETKAQQNAQTALSQLKDRDKLCFVGLWAYNPPAILTALEDKIKKGVIREGQVKVVAFDENADTLQGIIDNKVHATVVQDPFKFGYESVRIMAGLAKGDQSVLPKGGILDVPHRIITRDGGKDRIKVADFQAEMKKLLGK
jgi:ribose transport system substrate-binding protein